MPRAAGARTVTTTYQYNADGAAIAAARQVDDGPPDTTYFTWDNFTPDSADPGAGTVASADGNLLSIGQRPGAAGATTQFTYDQRDRLIGCRAAGQPSVAYAYHPASLMASSTLASGDALQFYYDNGGAPRATNLRQPSSGATASFLGSLYYPGDGSEQVLVGPRKDTAGVYTPIDQSFSPAAYDPYGKPLDGVPESRLADDGMSYDLGRNAFRYAGEYEDAVCATYYLRARWYSPWLQSFLSRDHGDPWFRYSYTGGNPITRTDPTGLRFSYGSYSRTVNHFMARLGLGATVLSLVPTIGELVFAAQLTANPSAYFHSRIAVGTLALSVAAAATEPLEVLRDIGTGATGFYGSSVAGERYLNNAFRWRLGVDVKVGAGQALAAGLNGNPHKRFDPAAFGETAGVVAGWMLVGRVGAGVGFTPHGLTSDDVDRRVATHFAQSASEETELVFRMRDTSSGGPASRRWAFTSPALERFGQGFYNEGAVAIGPGSMRWSVVQNTTYDGDVVPQLLRQDEISFMSRSDGENPTAGYALERQHMIPRGRRSFQFVGAFPRGAVAEAFGNSPLGALTDPEIMAAKQAGTALPAPVNSQAHVRAILGALTP